MKLTRWLTLVVLLGHELKAQVCDGAAPFSRGPVRIGAGFSYSKDVNTYGGGLAFAIGRTGPFISANGFAVEYDGVEELGTGFTVSAGVPVRVSTTAEFCPIVGFSHESVNLDSDVGRLRLTARTFLFGGSIGFVAASSPSFEFVPSIGAAFGAVKTSASLLGESANENDSYVGVSVAGGFIFSRRITMRPSLSYPFGVEEPEPSIGLAIGVNFGQTPVASSLKKP